MLQKFLFVGVGGSGGVTLRALRALLLDYLTEHGYQDGIPAAWQFVHIDVPLEQDRRPERIPLLPSNNYVGLAVEGLHYRNVDDMMCGHGQPVVRHTAGWRPDPNQVNVAPETGGGRFRAVGRVVFGARMAAAHRRLSLAMAALEGEATNTEFSRICLALTGKGEPSTQPPQLVVVASLAGGSGSGLFGDVCDLLRQLDAGAEDRLVSILYTPEVFDELAPADRAGINPNALGALCELLNGRWNRDLPAQDEFAFVRAAGAAAVNDVQRRGPRIPYMIGRSNGVVTYANQGDVYEAVARGLAAWTTSDKIQSRFISYEIGNWTSRATIHPDSTGLIDENVELPLSSFGCASIGIGLDRFARYSVDRLTREVAEHLLSGHWRDGAERHGNEEQARRQRVEVACAAFLVNCKLEEKGQHCNDIIDAIRGGVSDAEARVATGGKLKPQLHAQVTEHWPKVATADLVARRVIERMDGRWRADFAGYEAVYLRNAAEWAGRLQGQVHKHAADLLAIEGARVAFDVVHNVIVELTETVVAELRASLDSHRRLVGEMRTRVRAALADKMTTLPASHPRVAHAVDAALDSFHSATEALVYELGIELIEDLCQNLLTPLRDAIGRGRENLRLDYTGTSVHPSPVPGWPVNGDLVPARYYPARNELVLEKVASYPRVFVDQIRAQVNEPFFGNAITKARHEIITGIRENDTLTQTVVETTSRWAPRDLRLRSDHVAEAADFAVHIGIDALRNRTRGWIRRPDTPMARHLRQTLRTYLDDRGQGRQRQAGRLEEFRAQLAQAVALSRPLVAIDPPVLSRVHGGRQVGYREEMTPLPFPAGHPARDAAATVFAGRTEAQLQQLFGDEDQERIDIFTFLDAPVQPVVMSSLTYPISAQWAQDRVKPALAGFWTWRRARQLPWFVPCTPAIRKDLVRGWFVARFLNQVRCAGSNPRTTPTEIWTPRAGYVAVPFPLLGRPIRKLDEWLPAVLESLALTVIGEPFAPYARLRQLGQPVPAGDELSGHGELVRWVRDGTTEPGAPEPQESFVGTASDPAAVRLKVLTENLDKYRRHYESYDQLSLTPVSSLDVSRAWELRSDILDAISSIRHLMGTVLDAVDVEGIG